MNISKELSIASFYLFVVILFSSCTTNKIPRTWRISSKKVHSEATEKPVGKLDMTLPTLSEEIPNTTLVESSVNPTESEYSPVQSNFTNQKKTKIEHLLIIESNQNIVDTTYSKNVKKRKGKKKNIHIQDVLWDIILFLFFASIVVAGLTLLLLIAYLFGFSLFGWSWITIAILFMCTSTFVVIVWIYINRLFV